MRQFYKHFMALALLLMLQVSTVFAVNVTYSLKTHIDGRPITGTANLNEGATLESGMPRALWRANTTYKYYSDPELTQEITVAPATDATVYVDYVFDPPFLVSSEGAEFYYYFNAFIGGNKYYLCDDLGGLKSNAAAQYRAHASWALYGDGYCLNLKAEQTGQWLTYSASAPVMADAPMTTGWQLYLSEYTKNGAVYETVILGTTTENQILHFDNTATSPSSPGIPSSQHSMGRFVLVDMSSWNGIRWDDHHKLVHYTTSYDQLFLSNSSFFFTKGTYQNIYSTVWRILKADGTWNPDIVVQKGTTQTLIGMPTGQNKYTERGDCNYDRYYKDSEFSEKYPDDYMIPVTGNTIIYIKESYKNGEPFVTDHWITLVLSYNVNNLANEWGYAADGVTPAVRVLEYTALTTNASNTKYALTFTETDKIEAHKPYLFKADEVLEGKYLNLAKDPNWGNKTQEELDSYVGNKKVTWKDNANNSPDVTMIGTYYDKELTVLSEHPNLLYFYFGYDKRYDSASSDYVGETAAEGKYPYNFYRVTQKPVTMKKNRCYFMIEGAPAGAKLMLMDNFGEVITGIEGFEVERTVPTGRIYNLNGQVVGNDLEALPRGVYIVNGKKVMK
jgi:hypothetical protein